MGARGGGWRLLVFRGVGPVEEGLPDADEAAACFDGLEGAAQDHDAHGDQGDGAAMLGRHEGGEISQDFHGGEVMRIRAAGASLGGGHVRSIDGAGGLVVGIPLGEQAQSLKGGDASRVLILGLQLTELLGRGTARPDAAAEREADDEGDQREDAARAHADERMSILSDGLLSGDLGRHPTGHAAYLAGNAMQLAFDLGDISAQVIRGEGDLPEIAVMRIQTPVMFGDLGGDHSFDTSGGIDLNGNGAQQSKDAKGKSETGYVTIAHALDRYFSGRC